MSKTLVVCLVCVSLAAAAMGQDAGAVPKPAAQARAGSFHPGVIWGGAAYVDVRQFADITGTTWARNGTGGLDFSGPFQFSCSEGGAVMGPGTKTATVKGPLSYGPDLVFVHARLFPLCDKPIRWDDARQVLTVDGTHEIRVLDPGSFFSCVAVPVAWGPALPSERVGIVRGTSRYAAWLAGAEPGDYGAYASGAYDVHCGGVNGTGAVGRPSTAGTGGLTPREIEQMLSGMAKDDAAKQEMDRLAKSWDRTHGQNFGNTVDGHVEGNPFK